MDKTKINIPSVKIAWAFGEGYNPTPPPTHKHCLGDCLTPFPESGVKSHTPVKNISKSVNYHTFYIESYNYSALHMPSLIQNKLQDLYCYNMTLLFPFLYLIL